MGPVQALDQELILALLQRGVTAKQKRAANGRPFLFP